MPVGNDHDLPKAVIGRGAVTRHDLMIFLYVFIFVMTFLHYMPPSSMYQAFFLNVYMDVLVDPMLCASECLRLFRFIVAKLPRSIYTCGMLTLFPLNPYQPCFRWHGDVAECEYPSSRSNDNPVLTGSPVDGAHCGSSEPIS